MGPKRATIRSIRFKMLKSYPFCYGRHDLAARNQGLLAARFQVGGLSQGGRATGAPRQNEDSCRGIPEVGRGIKIEQH